MVSPRGFGLAVLQPSMTGCPRAPPPPAGWDVVQRPWQCCARSRLGVSEWRAAWWVPEVVQLPLGPNGGCSGRWRVPAAPHPDGWVAALG
eukprot:397604-Pyramimonas_sp.AAC.1